MNSEPTTNEAPGPATEQKSRPTLETIDVYWRRGCPFCSQLFRVLEHAGVPLRRHDIWSDDDAREFVRAHNNGNETVPTVALGDTVLVNPDPIALLDALEARSRMGPIKAEHGH